MAAWGQGRQGQLNGLALGARPVFGEANGSLVVDLHHHMGADAQGAPIVQRPVLNIEFQGPVATGQVGSITGGLDRDSGLTIRQHVLNLLHRYGCRHFLEQA